MKTILFVHHSAGLYGADKVLLSLVEGLDRSRFRPIVLLPKDGPLRSAFEKCGIRPIVLPLVLVSRAIYKPFGLIGLFFKIERSIKALDDALDGIKVDLVHSNTLAVLSGAFWAKRRKVYHVWHVHEMICHPFVAKHMFPLLLRRYADRVVCNSKATLDVLLSCQPSLKTRSMVVWNGAERKTPSDAKAFLALRRIVDPEEDSMVVALVGRINRWKGHLLLVEAADLLKKRGVGKVSYIMAGSSPSGQHHFRTSLDDRISASPLGDRIKVIDFRENVWEVWDACDIAVVPSTEPEPFGMVVLEAMLSGKPVVAAGHGGLTDIVVHDETGLLFKPRDANALADAIEVLVRDHQRRAELGSKGLERAKEIFPLRNYIVSFESIYESV